MSQELKEMLEQIDSGFKTFRAEQTSRLDYIEKYLAAKNRPEGGGFSGGERSHGGFRDLGEFAQCVARAAMSHQVDSRLRDVQAAMGGSETIPSDGGWLVQKDFSADLLNIIYQKALVASRCNKIPISANSNGIRLPLLNEVSRLDGSRWGGIQVYYGAESASVTKSKPTFRLADMTLKKLFGLSYVTDELLADSEALSVVLSQAFQDEMAFKIDDGCINGTGVGQPLGILNSGALIQVVKESGQKAGTVMFENLGKMFARMPGRNRSNAVWFCNQDVLPQLFTMSLAVGTGGAPVFLPGGMASAEPYPTLFGRPIITIEQCPTCGTLGDIVFADMSAYILIDKGAVQQASSIHVQFLTDEMTFRWIYRFDGQPQYLVPITPYKGSNTYSPFVALQTRS